jgi:hypothetical protein
MRGPSIGLIILLAGCAATPPLGLRPAMPVLIDARVESVGTRPGGIDVGSESIDYRSVELIVESPAEYADRRVAIYSIGLPNIAGVRVQPGDRLRFTVPAHVPQSCCGPLLRELADLQRR